MTDKAVLPATLAFLEGKNAALNGATYDDNPYARGFTKLGAIKPSDETRVQFDAWAQGRGSIGRHATVEEIRMAAMFHSSHFKRKSNRYYAS